MSESNDPQWLREAPAELQEIMRIGFEMFGDDHGRVVAWLRRLVDHAQVEAMEAEQILDDEFVSRRPAAQGRRRSTPAACSNAGHDTVFRSGVQDRCNTCGVDF